MAPKEAASSKKLAPTIVRYPISESSLFFIPNDAIEGYQERIETGIDWTLEELALRHHREQFCNGTEFPTVTFRKALENRIKKSYLGGFLDEESNIPLDQQYEVILSMKKWDDEYFTNEEGKICVKSVNSITDDLVHLIKEGIRTGDRQTLWNKLKMVDVLRVNDAEMTELDDSIFEFPELVSLTFCGNRLKNVDAKLIPSTVRTLELQVNCITSLEGFAEFLPPNLLYVGLSKNLLTSESIGGLSRLPYHLEVLDLSDNNIYDLEPVVEALARLPNLVALYLAGNPCAVSAGYARLILMRLQRLKWLDSRQILPKDRPVEGDNVEIHPDDLRSTYFFFNIFRVMGVPQPPKSEKGATTAFHIELEIPLLDAKRRQFLFFRRHESLTEMLPPPEDDYIEPMLYTQSTSMPHSKSMMAKDPEEASSHASDIYLRLVDVNSLEIRNYTTFESNRVQWNKIMNFQEPTVKIFCPDLVALKNTFRSVITIRLVYSVVTVKSGKPDKKSVHAIKGPTEQRVTLATIRCALKNPDWTQPSQHFHWDDTLDTNDAIHWGDGDLAILQYSQLPGKAPKGKLDTDTAASSRQNAPENLTCHFGFGIDTLKL